MKKTLIIINAGHGGMDANGNNLTDPEAGKETLHVNGKTYHNGGWFYEGVFNREIAAIFEHEARAAGYETLCVYDDHLDTTRKERIDRGNKAAKGRPAVWISFHANAIGNTTAPQTVAEGCCVFVYRINSGTGSNALKICTAVQNVFDLWGSKRRAQLVHEKPLDETQNTSMPAMLFEIGFFDNPNNADLLINPNFQKHVVIAMLNEIEKIYE